jgi:PAS domain S-box-containing protein
MEFARYSNTELIGQNHNIIRHPDMPRIIFKLLWDTIKNKQTYKATVKNLKKDGSAFFVNTTVTPILDENNEIIEYIAIRYDVTKEIQLQDELEEKQKMMPLPLHSPKYTGLLFTRMIRCPSRSFSRHWQIITWTITCSLIHPTFFIAASSISTQATDSTKDLITPLKFFTTC